MKEKHIRIRIEQCLALCTTRVIPASLVAGALDRESDDAVLAALAATESVPAATGNRELARIPMARVAEMEEGRRRDLRREAARMVFTDGPAPAAAETAPGGAPKEIIKEGLSEYFIYTIEGTETIADGWSKRMRAVRADAGDAVLILRARHQVRVD